MPAQLVDVSTQPGPARFGAFTPAGFPFSKPRVPPRVNPWNNWNDLISYETSPMSELEFLKILSSKCSLDFLAWSGPFDLVSFYVRPMAHGPMHTSGT